MTKTLAEIIDIHKLPLERIKIATIENTKVGMPVFAGVLVLLYLLYYADFLLAGLFNAYGYQLGSLTLIQWILLTLLFFMVGFAITAIVYGIFYKATWARRFALIFCIWALIWPVWGLLITHQVVQNLILLVVDLLLIGYLLLRSVRDYFLSGTDICIIGNCVLYKKDITLKSGRAMTIYFFSTHIPKSGRPSPLPVGYTVEINGQSGMPYLRKIHHAYHYGPYTLYSRDVELRNGRKLPIYFFSKHRPKSGTPSPRPKGYVIKENPLSHMPYLKRKAKNQ